MAEFGDWSSEAMTFLGRRVSNHFVNILLRTPVTRALHVTLYVFSLVCIGGLIYVALDTFIAHKVREGAFYSSEKYYSAVLIQGFLEVAYGLTENAIESPRIAYRHISRISARLRLLARISAKPWVKYTKSAYGNADPGLARCGGQISLTINEWLIELAFAGADMAIRVCDALEFACAGQWAQITPTGSYSEGVKSARAFLIIRRLLSAAASIGIALISYVYFRRLMPHFYLQAIVIACFGFATAQLLSLVDSNSESAIDAVTKIGAMFKKP